MVSNKPRTQACVAYCLKKSSFIVVAGKVIPNSEFVIPDYIIHTTSLRISCSKMHRLYRGIGLPFCFLFSPAPSSPTKLFLVCLIFPALMNNNIISYIQWDMPFSIQAVNIFSIPGGAQQLSEQYLPETERAWG